MPTKRVKLVLSSRSDDLQHSIVEAALIYAVMSDWYENTMESVGHYPFAPELWGIVELELRDACRSLLVHTRRRRLLFRQLIRRV